MIKISVFLTRRSDLTHDEFLAYWTERHTPLLADLPPGALNMHKYVQLQPTKDKIPGIGTATFDGVAELWVDTVDDASAWFTSETYLTAIASDEQNFLDRSATRFLYSTENVIFG
ncbi:MAG: EthD domain-containing protein [Pseudonocardia sp.]|nr:EthD domain-containing protein [Pseudonocardia sp.]